MKKIFPELFLIVLALFSLGQLERLQLTKAIAFYLHDLILVLWLILSVLKFPHQWQNFYHQIFTKNLLPKLIIVWITLGLFLHYMTIGFSFIPLFYLARTITYALFGVSLSFIKPYSKRKQLYLWILTGVLIAFWGVLQYYLLPDTRFIYQLGWDDHYYRLISTQLDPNFTGLIIVLTFFLIQKIPTRLNLIKTVLAIFLTLSLLLTYSRASYLSFIISSGALIVHKYFISHKINKLLLFIMGLLFICLPFLPRPAGEGVKLERVASISSRVETNSNALKELSNYQWLTGKGAFVVFEPTKGQKKQERQGIRNDTAHFPGNLFVFILTSFGIIGLISFIFILYKFGVFLYQEDIFIFTAFIAILIHAQFNHSLFQPFIWLWISSWGFSRVSQN